MPVGPHGVVAPLPLTNRCTPGAVFKLDRRASTSKCVAR